MTLEAEFKRLEAEHHTFFAGRLPRPSWETRGRVDAMIKRVDRMRFSNYGDRFRLTTIQSRSATFVDLLDRALPAREEGRAGPFAQPQPIQDIVRRPRVRILFAATFNDPPQQMDKLQDLYNSLTEARRETDEAAIPFDRFAELIMVQVGAFRERGRPEVAFRVALKGGKVAFTARAKRGRGGAEKWKSGKDKRGRDGSKEVRRVAPGAAERHRAGRDVVLGFRDVPCLRALRTVDDLELDRLALFQGPESGATDRGIVHEHVAATLAFNEPVALGVIEPLDLACDTHRCSSLLAERAAHSRWIRWIECRRHRWISFGAQKKAASACAASTSYVEGAPLTQAYPKRPLERCQARVTWP